MDIHRRFLLHRRWKPEFRYNQTHRYSLRQPIPQKDQSILSSQENRTTSSISAGASCKTRCVNDWEFTLRKFCCTEGIVVGGL